MTYRFDRDHSASTWARARGRWGGGDQRATKEPVREGDLDLLVFLFNLVFHVFLACRRHVCCCSRHCRGDRWCKVKSLSFGGEVVKTIRVDGLDSEVSKERHWGKWKKLHRKEMKQLGDLQEGERSRGGCSGRGGKSRNVSINKQLESDDMFAWYRYIHLCSRPSETNHEWISDDGKLTKNIARWCQTVFASPSTRPKDRNFCTQRGDGPDWLQPHLSSLRISEFGDGHAYETKEYGAVGLAWLLPLITVCQIQQKMTHHNSRFSKQNQYSHQLLINSFTQSTCNFANSYFTNFEDDLFHARSFSEEDRLSRGVT